MTMALFVRISVFGRPDGEQNGNGLSVQIPVEEGIAQLRQRGLRRGRARRLVVVARGDRGEVRQCRCGGSKGPGFPATRQGSRHPLGVQVRPGAVGDDGVQPGVQGIDQRLVVLGDRIGDEVAQAEGVRDNHRRVTRPDHVGRQRSRRHPGVDLARLEAGIHGGEAGILHRLQVQGVDDVGLLDGALDDADTLPGGQIGEFVDRRAGRHHQRVVAKVVAVGERDGAPPRVGGFHRRRADVEAPGRHFGEQRRKIRADKADLQAQLAGDGEQELIVEAAELAGGVDADVRRGVRQGADGQHAWRVQSQCADVHGAQRLDGGCRVLVVVAHAGRFGEVFRQDGRAVQSGRRALVAVGGRGRSRCGRRQAEHDEDRRGYCQ